MKAITSIDRTEITHNGTASLNGLGDGHGDIDTLQGHGRRTPERRKRRRTGASPRANCGQRPGVRASP